MHEQVKGLADALQEAQPAQFEDSERIRERLHAEHERIAGVQHRWRQSGPHLKCNSKACGHEHGYYIGINKMLIGFKENGEPILKDR